MKKILPGTGLFLLGIVVGGLAALLIISHCHLNFDPKISLGEMANAIATIVAAVGVTVLITYYLERHNQTTRREKDLLLDQLTFISDLVSEFEKSIEDGELIKIVSVHKRLSTANTLFWESLKDCCRTYEVSSESNFTDLIREVRRLATDTPIREIESHVKRSKCNTTVKDGIISLASERRNLLDGKLTEIKSKIFKTQLHINCN
jgi:MarR-like DNA-binding transcriptional regulator SgrR of sgrS sRNA